MIVPLDHLHSFLTVSNTNVLVIAAPREGSVPLPANWMMHAGEANSTRLICEFLDTYSQATVILSEKRRRALLCHPVTTLIADQLLTHVEELVFANRFFAQNWRAAE